MAVYDLCVVGAGMIGSAAARHASRDRKVRVCLIGPSETKVRDERGKRDIFGSHYDEGRITRSCDPSPVWATLAKESIKRYRDIEKESGIQFYDETGVFMIGPKNSSYINNAKWNGKEHGSLVTEMGHAKLAENFPYLRLAEDDVGIHERQNAGYVSPRKLVEAQKVISRNQGCTIIDDVVCSVERVVQQDGTYAMRVKTEDESEVLSKSVLLATGAFTSLRQLLPVGVTLEQKIRGATVALVEVDEAFKESHKSMPAVIYKGWGRPDFHKFPGQGPSSPEYYMLPPIKYPDGRTYVKLGYYHDDLRVFLTSSEDVRDWFVNGSKLIADNTAKFFASVITDLKLDSWHSDFCFLTETPTLRPYIDTLHSQLGVAIGGNGQAAKSSDEIGRLAASMMLGGWDSTIPREMFRIPIAADSFKMNSKL